MLINVGYGNMVNSDKIVAIVSSDSAPSKRLIQQSKQNGNVIDATQGRKTKAVVITDSHVVLSAMLPDTIAGRFEHLKGEDDE